MPSSSVHSVQAVLLVPDHREPPILVQANWSYRRPHPFAVHVGFLTRDGFVEWSFARDLLVDGLTAPAGEGDVEVRPHVNDSSRLILELRSPDGSARFELDRAAIAQFVRRSLELVPRGEEDKHVDRTQLESLLTTWLAAGLERPADAPERRHPDKAADEASPWLD